ncbi:hypothetical protein [Amycolatopsis sp.]|uniref:hypothetical protein n=1 Tax=Amycolatopsis sp. TaxID=37632 RepID=UPI002B66DA1E|nr:hypothetical protein [Amycolatopsis sp.]HVV10634.1 hypothetical protein [Amycolatopsis sp.]
MHAGRLFSLLAATTGLIVLVAGTFLPWFHSGNVQRNSYQTAGVADRLSLLHNEFAAALLHGWIAVPLLSAVFAGLVVLGLRKTGATLTMLLAISVGTIAAMALVQGGGGLIGITPAGPVTTLAGAIVALAGALGGLFTGTGRRRRIASRTGGRP